jgi:hypothetical protein
MTTPDIEHLHNLLDRMTLDIVEMRNALKLMERAARMS